MSFLYPSALWFLTLLAIPIIIHLFNLRRYEKVYFSNVNFLNSIKSSSRSKLTIKQWLALICRLLAIAFLVITFAIPFLKGDLTVNSEADKIIFLDNSFSNSNISSDGLTAFDNSSERVIKYLDQFNLEDKFQIVTNNFASRTPQTSDQITDFLSEISLTSNRKSLSTLIDQNENNPMNYYVFSDFQKNQFSFAQYLKDTAKSFYFFPAYYELSRNVFVDSVFLDNPVLNEAVDNQLTIRLLNTGSESVSDLPVFFTVNDAQVSSNSVDIAPDSYTDLRVDISGLEDSVSNCLISFEDFPVTFDNNFYFSLRKTNEIKVLEITDNNSPDYISEVYESDLFSYSAQDADNINYSLLAGTDFLILNQLDNYDINLKNIIAEYISSGGRLLLIPSKDFTDVGFLSIITGGNVQLDQRQSGNKELLDKPSSDNPFFSGVFEDKTAQIDDVKTMSQYNWRHGEDILNFRNDQPFLTKFSN
ncbi:MAG: BatA domain-containing protein, partial [Cyclobacteriaceae bacterium]